jgi:recombination protein RecA
MLKPETIKDINKRDKGDDGELKLTSLVDDAPVLKWASTGCPSVDLALGKGIPIGRVVEFFGPKETGKTALCLSIAKSIQDLGEDVVWIDAEYSLVPAHLSKLDPARFYVHHPAFGEEATDLALSAIAGGVGLVVIDSIPALVPKAEVEGTMEQLQVGALARLMTKFIRKAAPLVARSESTLVLINQTRTKIGVMYGNPETVPGGSALGYYASIRARVAKKEDIKNGSEIIGMRCSVTSEKNRVSARKREGFFDVLFHEGGVDYEAGLLDAAQSCGVIVNKAGHISFVSGEKLGYGKDACKKILREDPSTAAALYQAVMAANG